MMRKLNVGLLFGLILVQMGHSYPSTDLSLVVSTTEATKEAPETQSDPSTKESPVVPKIYDMQINTNVSNRFAKTKIASKVKNLGKQSQEAKFSVALPEQAYITGFIMEIDGKQYEAYIKEKEEAKKAYDEAVNSGFSAGHVAVSARDSNRFTVSVNIEPQSKATFYLTYEELLKRRNEQYEIVLNIHPGQPVKNLNVEVFINETRPLRFVKAPSLRSGNEISKNNEKLDPLAEIKSDKTTATVKFSPDLERQKQLAQGLGTKEENGLSGQFIVQYDVERDPKGGEILVNDGYFVHFFAPSDLPSLPKQVVFVLDTSGSMDGIRIQQLKEAMNSIISELKPEDIFNIVEFDSSVKVWDVKDVQVKYESGDDSWYPRGGPEAKPIQNETLIPAFPADAENLKKAKEVIGKLNAFGGTNIEAALKTALDLVELSKKENATQQPIIVFLTDGEPTVGQVSTDKIISKVTELNTRKTPIFSLSFGDGADRDFLQKISLKNLGFARHIYEGADASIQLQDFYKEISSPLLSDVKFKYVSNVTQLTKTHFPILFRGSELIVSGEILDPGFSPQITVEGWGKHGPIELIPQVERPVGSLERLWAYLTVKQILEQRDTVEDKKPLTEALKLALKYKFVTDVSSLVVVKPNSTSKAVETEDASKNPQGLPFNAAPRGGQAYFARLPSAPAPSYFAGSFGPAASSGFGGAAPLSGKRRLGVINFKSVGTSYHSLIQPQFEQVDADFDLIPSTPRLAFSTTPSLPESPTTSEEASTTTTSTLEDILPWLKSILNENGTLTLSKGQFKLGLNETVTDAPECPTTPTNSTGVCTLINECPDVHDKLTSLQEYEKYFCPLNEFAGVCCPKKE